jgi:hypothetical protein
MRDAEAADTAEPGTIEPAKLGAPVKPAEPVEPAEAPARSWPGARPRFVRRVAHRLAASPAWRFGLAAVGSAVLVVTVYAAFVLTRAGQRLENIGLIGAQLRGAAVRAESLGYLAQMTVLTFALAILGLIAVAFVRRRPGLGVLVGAVMAGSVLLAEFLKGALPRPELVTGPVWILRNDFPSGTATVAAAIGIGALLVAPDRLRWVVLPIGAAFAAVIGQSTQVTGWHRMSGALGGVLLVISIASAALLLLAGIGLVQPTPRGRIHPTLRAAILVVPAGTLIISASALALLVAFPLLQVPTNADAAFLHTVFELLGFGFTVLAFVLFASVIEPFSLGRSRAEVRGAGPNGTQSPRFLAGSGDSGSAGPIA